MSTETTLDPVIEAAQHFTTAGWKVVAIEREWLDSDPLDRWLGQPTLDPADFARTYAAHPGRWAGRTTANLEVIIPAGWAALWRTAKAEDGVWMPPRTDAIIDLVNGDGTLYLFRTHGELLYHSKAMGRGVYLFGPGAGLSFERFRLPHPSTIGVMLASAGNAPSWTDRLMRGYIAPEPKVDHRRNPANADLDDRVLRAIGGGSTRPEGIRWDLGEDGKPMARSTFYRALERLRTEGLVEPGTPLRLTEKGQLRVTGEAQTSMDLGED